MGSRVYFFAVLVGLSVGSTNPTNEPEDDAWLDDLIESMFQESIVAPTPPSQSITEEAVILSLLKTDYRYTVTSILSGLKAAIPNTDWDESRVTLFVRHVTLPLTIPRAFYKTMVDMHALGAEEAEIVSALLKKTESVAQRLSSKTVLSRMVRVWTQFCMPESGNMKACPFDVVKGGREISYTPIERHRNAYLNSVSKAIEEGTYLWSSVSETGKRKTAETPLPVSDTKKANSGKTLRSLVLDKLLTQRSVSSLKWTKEFQSIIPGTTLGQVDRLRSEILEWTSVPMEFHALLASGPVDLSDTRLLASLEATLAIGHPEPVAELARVWIQYCVDPLGHWMQAADRRGTAPCYAEKYGTVMRLSCPKTVSLFRQLKAREDAKD